MAEESSFCPWSSSQQHVPIQASKQTQRSSDWGGSASLGVEVWVEGFEAKSFQVASSMQVSPPLAFELAFGCLRDVTIGSSSCFD